MFCTLQQKVLFNRVIWYYPPPCTGGRVEVWCCCCWWCSGTGICLQLMNCSPSIRDFMSWMTKGYRESARKILGAGRRKGKKKRKREKVKSIRGLLTTFSLICMMSQIKKVSAAGPHRKKHHFQVSELPYSYFSKTLTRTGLKHECCYSHTLIFIVVGIEGIKAGNSLEVVKWTTHFLHEWMKLSGGSEMSLCAHCAGICLLVLSLHSNCMYVVQCKHNERLHFLISASFHTISFNTLRIAATNITVSV